MHSVYKVLQWAPLLTLATVVVAFPTPLGVIAALAAAIGASVACDWARHRLAGFGVLPNTSEWISEPASLSSLARHKPGEDRVIGWGEIAMGGPTYQDWLLADGAIVEGVSSAWVSVGDRYRVAMTDPRHHRTCAVYDSKEHTLHRCEGDRVQEQFDRLARMRNGPRSTEVVKNLLRAVEPIPLQSAFGLWIEHEGEYRQPARVLQARLRSGVTLTARLAIPEDLRVVDQPNRLVRSPPYSLFEDEAETGLHVLSLERLHDSEDLAVLHGVLLDSDLRVTDGVWHLRCNGRWRAIASYATGRQRNGGGQTPYFLSVIRIASNRSVEFGLAAHEFTVEGTRPLAVPDHVELRVSWSAMPLLLRTADDWITVRVPA